MPLKNFIDVNRFTLLIVSACVLSIQMSPLERSTEISAVTRKSLKNNSMTPQTTPKNQFTPRTTSKNKFTPQTTPKNQFTPQTTPKNKVANRVFGSDLQARIRTLRNLLERRNSLNF